MAGVDAPFDIRLALSTTVVPVGTTKHCALAVDENTVLSVTVVAVFASTMVGSIIISSDALVLNSTEDTVWLCSWTQYAVYGLFSINGFALLPILIEIGIPALAVSPVLRKVFVTC